MSAITAIQAAVALLTKSAQDLARCYTMDGEHPSWTPSAKSAHDEFLFAAVRLQDVGTYIATIEHDNAAHRRSGVALHHRITALESENAAHLTRIAELNGANARQKEVIGQQNNGIELLEIEVAAQLADFRSDAECFRFWVREAAQSPWDMARLIMRCVTEQDYRDAILPVALGADAAISKAAEKQKGGA